MKTPPWCRWLLGILVPEDRRDDVLGDLEEVHRQRLEDSSAAWLRTALETLHLGGAFVLYRLRERNWGFPWATGSDVRLGLRLIRKQPLLAAAAVLALAVGIGVATTGFTVLDSVFHGKLPFEGGERFTKLMVRAAPEGYTVPLELERYRLFQDAASFEHFGAMDRVEINILHPSGRVASIIGAWVTPSTFRYLPYVPVLGRPLAADDGAPGAPPVAVLRESLWKREYGGRSEILGEVINVAGKEYTVVGVLGDGAGYPTGGELWLPLDDRYLGGTPEEPRRGLTYVGILAEGTELETARREMETISASVFAEQAPERETRLDFRIFTGESASEPVAVMMMAALLALLAVIAANVANLILARTTARSGELAIRTALGAGRSRLIGQIGIEVALLGTLAAGIGLAGSRIALTWLEPRLDEKPFWVSFDFNPRILFFVLVATLLASLVGGIIPALKATRRDPARALQTHSRQSSTLGLGRLGALMVVVEMALAIALLSGALVIARGLSSSDARDLELPSGKILTADIRGPRPSEVTSPQADPSADLAAKVENALASIPGIEEVGVGSPLPRHPAPPERFVLAPEDGEAATSAQTALFARVRPGFFAALEAPAIAGRLIEDADLRPGALPVVVVNQPFVDTFLGGRNPIGRRLRAAVAADEEPQPWREIVGVVPDLGLSAEDPSRAEGYYIPLPAGSRYLDVMLNTQGSPENLAGPLRTALAALDPDIRVLDVVPLEEVGANTRQLVAGFGTGLILVGSMVLLLSLVGIYAVISFAVTRRTQEIGIRIALGATRSEILRTAIGGGVRFLVLGGALGVGLVVAAGALDVLDKLFALRLPAGEPWIIPAVLGILIAAGIAACWAPARRALDIEPTEALRS